MKLYLAVAVAVFLSSGISAEASGITSAVPMGTVKMGIENVVQETKARTIVEEQTDSLYINYLANKTIVANVNSYVNIRESATTDSEVVGKLYADCIGTLLAVEGDWIQIESGSVIGYVKKEYCYIGLEAEAKAKEVAVLVAKVETETLRVRKEADVQSDILSLVPMDDELIVDEQVGDWFQVEVENGTGYVSSEYVSVTAEHIYAESIEEENKRLAAEEAERLKAKQKAQAVVEALNAENKNTVAQSVTVDVLGSEIVDYAVQFIGNPYVYGGTDINNGIDCSGFTQYIYGHYGISLPRTSASYKTVGTKVGSLSEAQPGDIIVYSGHVAIYMGDNKIVHASNKQDGIKISNADYKKHITIRRII